MAVFGRSSRFKIKSIALIVFGAALFSMISFTYNGFRNSDVDTDKLQEHTGIRSQQVDLGDYDQTVNIDDALRLSWNGWHNYDGSLKNSRCYSKDGEKRCLPQAYVAGFPGCAPSFLYSMLLSHPDVLGFKQPLNYFDKFAKMQDMGDGELRGYLDQFKDFSEEIIDSGLNNKKLICDFGQIAARPYQRPAGASQPWIPAYTVPKVIKEMNKEAKFVLVTRYQAQCVFTKYSIEYPTGDFDTDLDEALRRFYNSILSLGSMWPTMFSEETYAGKVDLANCMYNYWIYALGRHFAMENVKVVELEALINQTTRWQILNEVFEFLGLDPVTPTVQDEINGLFGRPSPVQLTLSDAAKSKLDNFFHFFNSFSDNELGLGPITALIDALSAAASGANGGTNDAGGWF